MRVNEFIEAVRSYGTDPVVTGTESLGSFYEYLLDVEHPGTGRSRHYSNRQVRLLAAWLLIGGLTGEASNQHGMKRSVLRRHAMRLLAAAREGYVVMADGRAWWCLTEPVSVFRQHGCAVVIPVPAWNH